MLYEPICKSVRAHAFPCGLLQKSAVFCKVYAPHTLCFVLLRNGGETSRTLGDYLGHVLSLVCVESLDCLIVSLKEQWVLHLNLLFFF